MSNNETSRTVSSFSCTMFKSLVIFFRHGTIQSTLFRTDGRFGMSSITDKRKSSDLCIKKRIQCLYGFVLYFRVDIIYVKNRSTL